MKDDTFLTQSKPADYTPLDFDLSFDLDVTRFAKS